MTASKLFSKKDYERNNISYIFLENNNHRGVIKISMKGHIVIKNNYEYILY